MTEKVSVLESILMVGGVFGGGIAGVSIAQYADWIVLNEENTTTAMSNIANGFKAAPYFCVGAIGGLALTIGGYILTNYIIEKRNE